MHGQGMFSVRQGIKWFYRLSYYTGIIAFFYYLNRRRPRIVSYHHVLPDLFLKKGLPHLGNACSESIFEQHLSIITRRFRVGTSLTGATYQGMITFDDGYKNNMEIVAPILQHWKIAGVFFIPACYFEGQTLLWVDQLLAWISYVPEGDYNLLSTITSITTLQDREILWEWMYQSILDAPHQIQWIEKLLKETDQGYPYKALFSDIDPTLSRLRFTAMTLKELACLKDTGHQIGCHSFKHYILATLDHEKLMEDFEKSRPYRHYYNSTLFSYPFGGDREVSSREREQVKKEGYSAALMNRISIHENNDYALSRLSLGNCQDCFSIEAKLSGLETFLKQCFSRLYTLSRRCLSFKET